ncbi:MAG: 30S ribosomal protein S6 [Gemmataceae bacterium]|nr:30S ribosomal protein S6 [Gemmataceae bacterium]
MAAKVYECMFLLDTTKVAGDVAAADKQLRGLLEKNNAEVLVARPWDERRLTYPIRKQKKGLFYLTYFSAEGKSLVNIEHDCALNEMILRMLVLNIHPKMVDTMLALAKGEHAVALHNYQEPAAEEPTSPIVGPVGPVDDAAPPPRKRKEKAEKAEAKD